ncbi:hypothetical protein EHM69_02495 [candidate division KSB1 bacterium]|nr:MAG: hypothetical protein EHM69_02495 [candidate division KSB1 bacterium]
MIRKRLIPSLLCAMVMLLAVSCSTDFSTAPDLQNDAEMLAANPPSAIPVAEKGPMPGYRYLKLGPNHATSTLDDDPLYASRFIQAWRGGEVRISNFVRVVVPRWTLPYDVNLTITVPDPEIAAAEFGPHPLQFNGYVQIIWEIHEFDLPDDFDYDSVEAWYENDNGTFEPLQTSWDWNYAHLTVYTNHFSRYIITQKVTS